jgi:GNAT superfamily N-acetyltransferase
VSYARLIDADAGRLVVGTLDDVVLGFGGGEVEDVVLGSGSGVGEVEDVVLGSGSGVGEVEDVGGGEVGEVAGAARLGRVRELFVDPDARAVGLGEAILGELLAWFREQGCGGVDAMALPGHRQAKNFFEEQGFVARLLVMHHVPDPDPGDEAGRPGASDAADAAGT